MSEKAPIITGFHKSCGGKVSFDGKFPGMRKSQDFLISSFRDDGTILIQSDNRCATISLEDGQGNMSAPLDSANETWLLLCKSRGTEKVFRVSSEDVQEIREQVKAARYIGSTNL